MSAQPQKNAAAGRITVCLVVDHSTLDRIPTALRYLLVGLVDELFNVVLVAPESDRLTDIAPAPAVIITSKRTVWPISRWSRRKTLDAVMERIRSDRTDSPLIIHALAPAEAALALEISRTSGADLTASIWSKAELNHHALAGCVNHAAAVVVPSSVVAEAVRPRLGEGKPVETIPLGITAEAQGAAQRADETKSPAIVYAGPLTFDARIDMLLRAAKRAVPRHPGLLVFIIGKGPAEQSLRHLAAGLEIGQQVTFTGRVERLRTALAAANIFCLPSGRLPHREEPLHALAAGLAVISADGAPYDGLIDDRTALTFAEGNEDELADRLLRMLDEPVTAKRLGAAAQMQAKSGHSVAKMVAGHASLYRRLAAAHQTYRLPAANKT